MSQFPFGFAPGATLGYRSREEELSVGQFFNMVYAWMCVGLATTAAVAYGVFHFAPGLMNMGVFLVAFVAQMALVFVINGALNRISAAAATALFVLYSALMGVTLSVIFAIYAHATLAVCFVETAGLFGAMSVYGFVTKRDLTRIGSLLFMALIGAILASLLNLLVRSSALEWVLSYVIVFIFVGLTAFDTQRLKAIALQTRDNPAQASRLAISGSLILYLDFVNIFVFLLQIMGGNNRRN